MAGCPLIAIPENNAKNSAPQSVNYCVTDFRRTPVRLQICSLQFALCSTAFFALFSGLAIKEYVQDYKIQLIDPAKIQPEEFEKFSTSLREVLEYIKYSKDKKKLRKLVENNPRMTMEINAARVIQAVTGTKFRISEETEVVDMCQAIDEMMADSREDGMKEGIEKGIEKGMTLGLTKGLEKGRIEALSNLLKKGTISIQDAADCMAMSVTEFKKLVNTYAV